MGPGRTSLKASLFTFDVGVAPALRGIMEPVRISFSSYAWSEAVSGPLAQALNKADKATTADSAALFFADISHSLIAYVVLGP